MWHLSEGGQRAVTEQRFHGHVDRGKWPARRDACVPAPWGSRGTSALSPCGAAAAKSLQSCPPLCDSIDSSPPGSAVPGILQARTLEWVAISFSKAWKWKVKVKSLSHVRLLATPWTPAHQASPSMGFSRQEYWSGMPLPSLPCGAVSYLWQNPSVTFTG